MRELKQLGIALLCGFLAVLGGSAPIAAEETCPPGTLGVSRTIEVTTTGGPWFGDPYGDPNFLAAGEVVLTFDDGPSPTDTRAILAALAAECTKATFFVVGEMVAKHPEILSEVAAQGHTIGTHTWSHPNLARISQGQAIRQIESAFTAAQIASPQPVAPFFRYPYLSSSKAIVAYLKSRNVAQFAVDIDSLDWRSHDPKSVISRVMAGLKLHGRGIVLLHDIHKSTADSLPGLLAQIKAKGFKVVHLKAKSTVDLLAGYSAPLKQASTGGGKTLKRVQTTAHAKKTAPLDSSFWTIW